MRVRHKARKNTYRVLFTEATLQITGDADMTPMVVYQSEQDDSIWVRPRAEFYDGRFEVLADGEPSPISLEEVEAFLTDRMHEAGRTVPLRENRARFTDIYRKALYAIREYRDITRDVVATYGTWSSNIPNYHHLLRHLASKKKDFTESAHDTFDAVVDYIRAFAERSLEERAAAFNQARGIDDLSKVDCTMLRTMHLLLTIGRLDVTGGTPTRQQLDSQLREIEQVLGTDTYVKKEMTSDVLMGMVNNYMTASVAAIADETKSPDAECARGVLLEAFKIMGAK